MRIKYDCITAVITCNFKVVKEDWDSSKSFPVHYHSDMYEMILAAINKVSAENGRRYEFNITQGPVLHSFDSTWPMKDSSYLNTTITTTSIYGDKTLFENDIFAIAEALPNAFGDVNVSFYSGSYFKIK